MIPIKQDETRIPEDWLQRAQNATRLLDAIEDPEERKRFIDGHASLWREIKNQLLQMSSNKCWYSEAPDAVSDWHVDHFRPKKRALDLDKTEHEGYSWLAFDWRNFRVCGSFPNSPHKDEAGEVRGKRDYFPLTEGSIRASWSNRDCSNERCLLLDPINEYDTLLLTFDEEGTVKAVNSTCAKEVERVNITTSLFYLDAPSLVDGRKRRWRECMKWVDYFRRQVERDIGRIDEERQDEIGAITRNLLEMAQNDQPYSAVVRACLRTAGLGILADAALGAKAS